MTAETRLDVPIRAAIEVTRPPSAIMVNGAFSNAQAKGEPAQAALTKLLRKLAENKRHACALIPIDPGKGGNGPQRSGLMFFVMRLLFWFSLVLLFLPLGLSPTGTGQDSIGALQTILAAKQAIEDVSGMCERQPEVCVTGKAALRSLGVKARDTAKGAYETLDGQLEQGPPLPTPRPRETVGSITRD